MATTATLFTLAGKPFPFIGIGVSAAQLITPIPSAEIVFNLILGTVTVAAAGEDQSVLVNCPLPRSFCYVLVELNMRMIGANAGNWGKGPMATLLDSASDPSTQISLQLENNQGGASSSAIGAFTYQVAHVPPKLIVPLEIDNALLQIFMQNSTIDGAAGTLDFYARFLRYDRNQAQYWQVNTPVLTR